MREQIRAAFEPIRAEEEMQARTRAFLHERLYRHAAPRARRVARALRVAVCAFVLLLGVGGYASYATTVATISMDINPSLELSVNRYGRVIGVQGYNEDGRAVAVAMTTLLTCWLSIETGWLKLLFRFKKATSAPIVSPAEPPSANRPPAMPHRT